MKSKKFTYPLMENAADDLHAASGRNVAAIDLAAAQAGELSPDDLQIGADTLRAQADVAQEAGFTQLAGNLARAAELTAVPNAELLRMYEILRPGRSTYGELQTLAERLDAEYQAPLNAHLVREAAEVYRQRGLFKHNS